MKRIVLFILTNLAIMLMLSVVVYMTGANAWLTAEGINYPTLLAFCAIFGFGGSFLSLLISKPVAKWSTGARVITGNEDSDHHWLMSTVQELADRAGLETPEVAIYEGEPNAFATGAFRNSALVAVSTGLLHSMTREQVRAVLAHEVAHIANGDMQTMGLLQGVMNTFVMFAARVIGTFVDRAILKNEEGRGIGYFATVIVLELVLGLLASIVVMTFSRHREYRADAYAADLMGSAAPMQSALAALKRKEPGTLPEAVAAFGINGRLSSLGELLSSHPPLDARIEALHNWKPYR